MDQTVLRSLAKWPEVPAVYGWLALDRRGNWLLRESAAQRFGRIGNAAFANSFRATTRPTTVAAGIFRMGRSGCMRCWHTRR